MLQVWAGGGFNWLCGWANLATKCRGLAGSHTPIETTSFRLHPRTSNGSLLLLILFEFHPKRLCVATFLLFCLFVRFIACCPKIQGRDAFSRRHTTLQAMPAEDCWSGKDSVQWGQERINKWVDLSPGDRFVVFHVNSPYWSLYTAFSIFNFVDNFLSKTLIKTKPQRQTNGEWRIFCRTGSEKYILRYNQEIRQTDSRRYSRQKLN